ncbi:hypothetical protein ACFL3Q_11870 [Planctomycetota bacterium]
MATKSKKRKVKLYMITLASCIIITGIWAVLVTPETALAGKGGGKKVGGENIPVCASFYDASGDAIRSDGGDYCHSKQAKVDAKIVLGGHLSASTWGSAKAGDARGATIDFSMPVDVDGSPLPSAPVVLEALDNLGEPISFISTAEVVGGPDNPFVDTEMAFGLGGFRFDLPDAFDMRTMKTDDIRTDVNFSLRLYLLRDPAGRKRVSLHVQFDPGSIGGHEWRFCAEGSTFVEVECLAQESSDPESPAVMWKITASDDAFACMHEGTDDGPVFKGFFSLPMTLIVQVLPE